MTETEAPASETEPRSLDDVMLAMDVVDTLRHRERMVAKELDAEGREQALIDRLREIYAAQGIEVPDHILRDGVKALEERRFVYEPTPPGLQRRLAKIYISRDRWMKPLAAAVIALTAVFGVYEVAVAGPQRARTEANRIALAETIPADLETLHAAVLEATDDPRAVRLADGAHQLGLAAAAAGERKKADEAVEALRLLRADIAATYEIRVVYAGGQDSGFFRVPNDAPLTRNYYLIVEAVDAAGSPIEVPLVSEETQKTRRVARWAQRVGKSVFDRVAADKRDDQIIQQAVLGVKAAGRLDPDWTVDTPPGGAIFEW